MAEHESVFAAAVAAVRPLLLGGTIRDAERIVLAVLRAANAAADDGHPLKRAEAMEQLAAATARAEQAEAEAAHVANARKAYDRMRAERDEARARLAELRLLRLEWSTANCYSDLGDDIVSERLARDRVASRPEIHAAVVSQQIYAGPWCEGACRSCGTDERVAGDPPLCSNCAVYGGGWSSQRPDASLDGLRGPFTGLLGPFGLNGEESDNA